MKWFFLILVSFSTVGCGGVEIPEGAERLGGPRRAVAETAAIIALAPYIVDSREVLMAVKDVEIYVVTSSEPLGAALGWHRGGKIVVISDPYTKFGVTFHDLLTHELMHVVLHAIGVPASQHHELMGFE